VRATDGIIFVADSHKEALRRNINSWKELKRYFNKKTLNEIPKVIALNKQDLREKFIVPHFLREINYDSYENISLIRTIALNGEGILESFEEILRLILKKSYQKTTLLNNN
jgi:hypothetical protein